MHIEVHASYTSDCRWKCSNQWPHFLVSAETPLWVIQNLAPFTPPLWVPCCCHCLKPLRFHLICTASAGGEHPWQPALPCLEGEVKQGRLTGPMDWDPWEAKGIVLSCGSMVNAEQLSRLGLENTDFYKFHCSFLPPPSFFSCFHCFFTLLEIRETKPWAGLGTA